MEEPLAFAIALLQCLDSDAKIRLLREMFWLWPELEKQFQDSEPEQ